MTCCNLRGRAMLFAVISVALSTLFTTVLKAQMTATTVIGEARAADQPIASMDSLDFGDDFETGESGSMSLLVDDGAQAAIVVHVTNNSKIRVDRDTEDIIAVQVDRGTAVLYLSPQNKIPLVVTTPFGRLKTVNHLAGTGMIHLVRHDPEGLNRTEASTFAAIEGAAEVQGKVPLTPPRNLATGEKWTIVAGQQTLSEIELAGTNIRTSAEELRSMLNRQYTDFLQSGDESTTARGLSLDGGILALSSAADGLGLISGSPIRIPKGSQDEQDQDVVDVNTAVVGSITDVSGGRLLPVPVDMASRIRSPRILPAGEGVLATAQLISIEGNPANEDWGSFLTALDGNPAYQPTFISEFENGGFSYIQFAGDDAVTRQTSSGELFLTGSGAGSPGWAIFTPNTAVAGEGFDINSSALAEVVREGFGAIARGEHLADGGRIGGESGTGFAVVQDGNVVLNEEIPAGYPLLQQSGDTIGLQLNGEAISDQIAALGSGLDPTDLSSQGPQLLFLSDGDADGNGNTTDFQGDPIAPTRLGLPGETGDTREIVIDAQIGFPSLGTPLANNADNTVGIQFAPKGEIVAIIHHTGMNSVSGDVESLTAHFVVERGSGATVIRWRDSERPTNPNDPDGALLEMENLGDNVAIRNELFVALCAEVNRLVPDGQHTVCGPAVRRPEVNTTNGQNKSLVRRSLSPNFSRETRKTIAARRSIAASSPSLKSTGLQRATNHRIQRNLSSTRRHVTPRRR